MAGVLGDRWRWLGRPAFLAAVGVLALNDHVFKHRVPGWWTGKLSDVAGVAVVGTLAAVVLGVRRGLVATAASFCALKAVPGVAEAAAPVLGGVTARDRGDLVALGVLLPVALSLRRHPPCPVDDRRPPPPTAARRTVYAARRQLAAGASTVVPLLGAVAAVLVTTATSCAPEPAVTQVLARGGVLYALVDNGDGTGRWAESCSVDTPTARSMIGFARSPSTEEEPTCSTPSARLPRLASTRSRNSDPAMSQSPVVRSKRSVP